MIEAVDADLIAEALAWAAEAPAARGQTFNITNGDVFVWENVWPAIAQALGLEPAFDHPLCSFDRVDFEGHIRNQARRAKQTMSERPIARSAFVKNERPRRYLFQPGPLQVFRASLGMGDQEQRIIPKAYGFHLRML